MKFTDEQKKSIVARREKGESICALCSEYKDCVIAYLGDLGKNLSESERLYWKSYNIDSDEKLSRVTFERDFMCLPSESNMIDHKFQRDYAKVIDCWNKKYGWSIFLPLTE